MAKKILVIHSSGKISGAEKSLMDVLHILKAKYDVTVVLPHKGELYNKLYGSFIIKIFAVTGIQRKAGFIQQLKTLYNIFITSWRIYRFVKKQKTDLIYCNNTQASIYSILTSILTNTRHIWHVRDNLPNKTTGAIVGFFSDKIFCISQHIYKQLSFTKKKILLYNGINTANWKSSAVNINCLKKEMRIAVNTILIGQIGQLIPWKNNSLFIEVARQVIAHNNRVHFVLIGRDMFHAYPYYKKSLKEKINQANLQHHFTMLDFTDNIMDYMQELDILIHLAQNEPFGRVIIEAMALEKPVIALNSGGPQEIISHGRSGYLIDLPDAAIIAEKLNILVNDAALRKQFGTEGRKIINEKFNIGNLEKINDIISSLLH